MEVQLIVIPQSLIFSDRNWQISIDWLGQILAQSFKVLSWCNCLVFYWFAFNHFPFLQLDTFSSDELSWFPSYPSIFATCSLSTFYSHKWLKPLYPNSIVQFFVNFDEFYSPASQTFFLLNIVCFQSHLSQKSVFIPFQFQNSCFRMCWRSWLMFALWLINQVIHQLIWNALCFVEKLMIRFCMNLTLSCRFADVLWKSSQAYFCEWVPSCFEFGWMIFGSGFFERMFILKISTTVQSKETRSKPLPLFHQLAPQYLQAQSCDANQRQNPKHYCFLKQFIFIAQL